MKAEMHRTSEADSVSAELDSLKESFGDLKKDVMNLLSHALGAGKNGVGAVEHGAADVMESLKEHGADTVAAAGKKIEENPLASAMIAFGIGFIVAKLLHRRHEAVEALANMLIATFDLVEAEGRALHRRLVHLGVAAALMLVGLLVAMTGIGFILYGLYGLLAAQMSPPGAAMVFGAAALVIAGISIWFARMLIL